MGGETRSAHRGAPHSRFSVQDIPSARRFDAWRESIACVFDVERTRTQAQDGDFHATLDCYAPGGVMLVHTRTSAQHWRRSALTVARDGMDHFMAQIYVKGSQRVDWSGGSLDMPARGLLIYDLSRETRAVSTDLSNISLIIPRPLVEDLLTAPDDHHMRALDGAQPLAALLLDHIQGLWRHGRGLSGADAAELAPATAHLLAACLNGAPHDDEQRKAADGALLRMLRRDIEARLTDPALGADTLCTLRGVSRSRLYRLFAPFGGVAAYIRDRRLHAAMRALTNPHHGNVSIADIGAQFGFDASGFSRAFQTRFGMSPRAARHHAAVPRPEWIGQGPDRRYESWLHTLAA